MTINPFCKFYESLIVHEQGANFFILFPPAVVLLTGLTVTIRAAARRPGLIAKVIVILVLGVASSFLAALVTLVLSFILVLLFVESANDIIASMYFPLNAAIKNTCYLDPRNLNCPRTLPELVHIEPERFSQMLSGKTVAYLFDPMTEEYTLFIRYDQFRGVMFDPRLSRQGTYGFDFVDTYHPCDPAKPPIPHIYSTDPQKNDPVKRYLELTWPAVSAAARPFRP